MTHTKDEALKLALTALEQGETEPSWRAIAAINAALAQPAQEPPARLIKFIGKGGYPAQGYTIARTYSELPKDSCPDAWEEGVLLYTTPQRLWVGLTHQETKDCMEEWDGHDAYVLCRAIETKLKELNT